MKLNDLVGQRFGRLVVSQRSERQSKRVYWVCKCDCGSPDIEIYTYGLTAGKHTSCGCEKKEAIAERFDAIRITEGRAGWFAGLFDGEGTIRINKINAGYGGKTSPAYQLGIGISMTHSETIEMFVSTFGGKVVQKPARKIKHKDAYTWHAVDNTAAFFIQLILPYLVTKRKQALLGLEFRNKLQGHKLIGKSTDPRITEAREEVYQQMLALNKKGPGTTAE